VRPGIGGPSASTSALHAPLDSHTGRRLQPRKRRAAGCRLISQVIGQRIFNRWGIVHAKSTRFCLTERLHVDARPLGDIHQRRGKWCATTLEASARQTGLVDALPSNFLQALLVALEQIVRPHTKLEQQFNSEKLGMASPRNAS